MEQDLTTALGRLTAHYQPIVDLNTGAIAGVGALARIVGADVEVSSIEPLIGQVESGPVLPGGATGSTA